jgi:DNA (cytosine-5)-methyltransferase 1
MQSKLKFFDGLVVDNFAGGGGASTGIELALGRPVDIAINHDEDAIAMHEANHPFTKHLCESVWDVDPREITNGNPVMLAWFSPSCTHFSKARGCKPVEKNIRGLAWVATRWAATVKPRVIMLENVEEFKTWGPLGKSGQPIKEKAGLTFNRFIQTLNELGYVVEWEELRACDYGAPTTRKRFFLIARSDGNPVRWPEPTHGPEKLPYRTAAEIIDWSIPCPSIFDSAEEIKEKYGIRAVRPLSEMTLKRIARGIQKFVINNPNPFIISIGQTGFSEDRSRSINVPLNTVVSKAEQCLVAPIFIQMGYGEAEGQQPRVLDLNKPLGTITAGGNKFAAASMFIIKNFGGGYTGKGISVKDPLGTVTAVDHHSLVAAHVIKFKGDNVGQAADEPLQTICSSTTHFGEVRTFLEKYCGEAADDAGIVNLGGIQYVISDIGMRMLTPRELFNAQGFPKDYIIDYTKSGKPASKTAQIARCGNSVCPPLAEALVRSNLPGQCGLKISTMGELEKEFGVIV